MRKGTFQLALFILFSILGASIVIQIIFSGLGCDWCLLTLPIDLGASILIGVLVYIYGKGLFLQDYLTNDSLLGRKNAIVKFLRPLKKFTLTCVLIFVGLNICYPLCTWQSSSPFCRGVIQTISSLILPMCMLLMAAVVLLGRINQHAKAILIAYIKEKGDEASVRQWAREMSLWQNTVRRLLKGKYPPLRLWGKPTYRYRELKSILARPRNTKVKMVAVIAIFFAIIIPIRMYAVPAGYDWIYQRPDAIYGPIGTITGNSSHTDTIRAFGNMTYVAAWDYGLYCYNSTNQTAPVLLWQWNPDYSVEDIAVEETGNVAWVVSSGGQLQGINVSDPTHYALVGLYNAPKGLFGIEINNGVAYIVASEEGLWCVNITDPWAPALLGTWTDANRAVAVAVRSGVAYVTDSTFGLRIVDISDPSHPATLGSLELPKYAWRRVSLVGDRAYLANAENGLRVINVSDPTNPGLLDTIQVRGNVEDVAIYGDLAFLANHDCGLLVINLTTRGIIGSYQFSWIDSVYIDGDHAYAVKNGYYIKIIPIKECAFDSPTCRYASVESFFQTLGIVGGILVLAVLLSLGIYALRRRPIFFPQKSKVHLMWMCTAGLLIITLYSGIIGSSFFYFWTVIAFLAHLVFTYFLFSRRSTSIANVDEKILSDTLRTALVDAAFEHKMGPTAQYFGRSSHHLLRFITPVEVSLPTSKTKIDVIFYGTDLTAKLAFGPEFTQQQVDEILRSMKQRLQTYRLSRNSIFGTDLILITVVFIGCAIFSMIQVPFSNLIAYPLLLLFLLKTTITNKSLLRKYRKQQEIGGEIPFDIKKQRSNEVSGRPEGDQSDQRK